MARRMRFKTWCGKAPEDTTKIVYTFHMKEWDGSECTIYFTSEDEVPISMIFRLREAWIESVERVRNEFEDAWDVVLYEDGK